jgi:hypothetical protein
MWETRYFNGKITMLYMTRDTSCPFRYPLWYLNSILDLQKANLD